MTGSDRLELGELIERLESTGKWWMIGKGQMTPGEPLWGCLIQDPCIDGETIAQGEGHSLPTCVERALSALNKPGAAA